MDRLVDEDDVIILSSSSVDVKRDDGRVDNLSDESDEDEDEDESDFTCVMPDPGTVYVVMDSAPG